MSQRENAGFSAARFPVAAGEPFGSVPEANVACRGNWSSRVRVEPSGLTAVVAIPGVSFQSLLLGVDQPANCATSFRYSGTVFWPLPFLKAKRFSIVSGEAVRSVDIGVGQPASCTACDRLPCDVAPMFTPRAFAF
jgi:hypothetical protein